MRDFVSEAPECRRRAYHNAPFPPFGPSVSTWVVRGRKEVGDAPAMLFVERVVRDAVRDHRRPRWGELR